MIQIDNPSLARLLRFLLGARTVQTSAKGDVYIERFRHPDSVAAGTFYNKMRDYLQQLHARGTIHLRVVDTEVIMELHVRGLAILSNQGQPVLCLAHEVAELDRVPSGDFRDIQRHIEVLADLRGCPVAA